MTLTLHFASCYAHFVKLRLHLTPHIDIHHRRIAVTRSYLAVPRRQTCVSGGFIVSSTFLKHRNRRCTLVSHFCTDKQFYCYFQTHVCESKSCFTTLAANLCGIAAWTSLVAVALRVSLCCFASNWQGRFWINLAWNNVMRRDQYVI